MTTSPTVKVVISGSDDLEYSVLLQCRAIETKGLLNPAFPNWMEENVGKFGVDWKLGPFAGPSLTMINIQVREEQYLALIKLVWGGGV